MINEHFGEPEEHNKLWGTFCDAEMLILGIEKLTWLCFNFTPASIEIISPKTLTFRENDLTDWMNDLLSKLHETGAVLKAVNSKNQLMEKNIAMLTRNSVLSFITDGKTESEISKSLGLPKETVEQFLNGLEKEGKIKKQGKKYIVK